MSAEPQRREDIDLAAFCEYLRGRGYTDSTVTTFRQKVSRALDAGVRSLDEIADAFPHNTSHSCSVIRTAYRAYTEFRGVADV